MHDATQLSVMPGVPGDRLATRQWPQIPAEMRQLVESLTEALHRERGDERSVQWESQLAELSHDIVERAMRKGAQIGVVPMASTRLSEDPQWRGEVEWAVMARASLLWPLSLLVYGDVEDIQFLGADRIIVEAGGPKHLMVGTPPAEFASRPGIGEEEPSADVPSGGRRAAEDRLVEWFRSVLSITGVQPKTALSRDQPQAVVVMPTAIGPARIAVTIEPAAVGRSVYACVRTPRLSGPTSLDDCVALGTMGPGQAAFLRACVAARLNIVISGGTGAGKTTTMVALAREIPEEEVVLTLEDTAELALSAPRNDGSVIHENTMEMVTVPGAWKEQEARVTMEDLGRSALRYLPSRILVGESRGAEMADICNAMTSGHEGSMVTVHANSAAETIPKIVNYVMMSPRFATSSALATRVAYQAIHVVVHMAKSQRHRGRKLLTGVTVYSADGAETAVYGLDENGPNRNAGLADLPARVRSALTPHLAEVPPP
jgi:Flp pilus assembly CpaF family ATPase